MRTSQIYMDCESHQVSTLPARALFPIVSVTYSCLKLLTWKLIALVMGFCLVVIVTVCSGVLLSCRSNKPAPAVTILPESPKLNIHDVPTILRFSERNEWGAQPPAEELTKLEFPVPYVVISYTATDFCNTQSECTYRARFAQTFHMESRGWPDIGYNFLIGGDGNAYVGRSWDYVGAHTYGYNAKSIGISFIGTFNSVVPPHTQLLVAQRLIKSGVKAGKIAPDYKLLAHRQISSTLSPGDALFDVIKTWPHWSSTP